MKKMGWKIFESHKKTKQKVKIALWALVILILVIMVGNGVRFVHFISAPLNKETTISKNYLWDGAFNINLVVKSAGLSVLSYNPKEKTLVLLEVGDEVYINVPGGFGEWQARSIFDLGENENPKAGDSFLVNSFSSHLEIPLDGYWEPGGSFKNTRAKDLILQLRSSPLDLISLLLSSKTNITLFEFWRFALGLIGIREDKIVETGNFSEDAILSEGLTIGVYNATDLPGIAQKVSRIISNMGGNVIISSNASFKQKHSTLSAPPSQTRKRLMQVFSSSEMKDEKYESRAEVNIFIGEDFAQKIN